MAGSRNLLALGCSGAGCAGLGLPVQAQNTLPVAPGAIAVANLGTSGAAQITIPLSFTLGGVPINITFVGSEIQRTFVPEPGTGGLLGLGLFLSALAGAAWRHRRIDGGSA